MIKCFTHKTVLLEPAIRSLNIRADGNYIDGTFGCGGHSHLILSKLGEKGSLLAIDRDPQAVAIAKTILDPRFSIINGSFSKMADYVRKRKLQGKINGILLDLGVSSLQIDNEERGFSFMKDGPLDMRMNPDHGISASKWINKISEKDLAWVLKTFGEERFYKKIAKAIILNRRKCSITRTKQLSKIVTTAIPRKDKNKHPATRTFQAIRIWINNELKELEIMLKKSLDILDVNGRLSVISFHSLESLVLKRFLFERGQNFQASIDSYNQKTFLKQENHCYFKMLKKIKPDKKEIEDNPRARSAILHIAEKTICD